MVDRYRGLDDLVSVEQVVEYLCDNYITKDGDDLSRGIAMGLVNHDIAWEWIQTGIAQRYTVSYVGDMIADRAELDEIPEDDDDWENEYVVEIPPKIFGSSIMEEGEEDDENPVA